MTQPTPEQLQQYREFGYLMFPQLFSSEEIEVLRETAKNDREMDQHAYDRGDGEGEKFGCRYGISRAKESTAVLPAPAGCTKLPKVCWKTSLITITRK